jgi:hypothetical protein
MMEQLQHEKSLNGIQLSRYWIAGPNAFPWGGMVSPLSSGRSMVESIALCGFLLCLLCFLARLRQTNTNRVRC